MTRSNGLVRLVVAVTLAPALTSLPGCGAISCRSPNDCPFGTYCVLEVRGTEVQGTCTQDCFEHDECPSPEVPGSRAICDNRGQCQIIPRVPRLRLRLPEQDTVLAEGSRSVQVLGDVSTASNQVTLTVETVGGLGCVGGPPIRARLENATGRFQTIPFSIDEVPVEPGTRALRVEATVGGVSRTVEVDISVPCPACPDVRIEQPEASAAVSTLLLPRLTGRVDPVVPAALWRIRGPSGAVFDGLLPVDGFGAFDLARLPLFGGTNRLEVIAVGGGEMRCSTFVQAPSSDRGFRAVLTWDSSASDLDLHLIGPRGRYLDPDSSLSPRTPSPTFGGEVLDDFDGLGPEILGAEGLPEGTYGLLVEPVVGEGSATLRLLVDGVPITLGPVGPRYIDASRGDLWVVGTVAVSEGNVSWRFLDEILSIEEPPTADPESWPAFRP